MVKPFIALVHEISSHLSTLLFSVVHLFPVLSCKESAPILQHFH